jgi:hypothetical protein
MIRFSTFFKNRKTMLFNFQLINMEGWNWIKKLIKKNWYKSTQVSMIYRHIIWAIKGEQTRVNPPNPRLIWWSRDNPKENKLKITTKPIFFKKINNVEWWNQIRK